MSASQFNSPPWSRATKAIVASAALILVALATWRFRALLAPIASAIILAYLFGPLIAWLQRQINVSRGTAVLIVYATFILLLLGGGIALGFAYADQFIALVKEMPQLTQRAITLAQQQVILIWNTPVGIGPARYNPAEVIGQLDARAVVNQISGLLQPFLTRGTSVATWFAQTTIRVVSLSLLVFALSIYLARDFPKFGRAFSDFAQKPGYRQDADRLLTDFARIWDAYLRGQVVLALVIGVVVTIVLLMLDVNNALGLGALAGILEFLPIVGPVVSTLVAVLVSFFQQESFFGLAFYWRPIAVAVAMLIIQQVENNVLVPRIVGKALDLHPLVTMVAVLMGASLAGILGAILAAPVVATLKLLSTYGWRKMLDLPPFADWETTAPPLPPPPTPAISAPEDELRPSDEAPSTDLYGENA